MSLAETVEKLIVRVNRQQEIIDQLTQQLSTPLLWGDVFARHLAIPALTGFWPMNGINDAGSVIDFSSQGRTLTATATGTAIHGDRIHYVFFDGATSYLSRADEVGLDITSGLTMGGWFQTDTPSASQGVIGKWGGAPQQSYVIQTSGSAFRVLVSSDGTATTIATSGTTIAATTWYHVVARYTPSTELAIWVDGVKVANTTSIPAALFNSTAAFQIGRLAATQYLDGRCALCFLSRAGSSTFPDALVQELHSASKHLFKA